MRKLRLDRELILKLYSYMLQAERSLDKALGADWSDLPAFYSPDRIEAIKQLVQTIRQRDIQCQSASLPRNRYHVFQGLRLPECMHLLLGKAIGERRKAWALPSLEVAFMAACLDAVVGLLGQTIKPDPNVLISLRMDLCVCRSIIEARCAGWTGIERAKNVEHFHHPEWKAPLSVEEVVRRCA
jgi:hypothetical protein